VLGLILMLGAGDGGAVDFSRDVKPILAARCFACHGPDAATREADLRLDARDELYKEVPGGFWIVKPGDPDKSELWYRVSTENENEAMPPSWSDVPRLDEAERAIVKRWIEEGGEWSGHWAYEPPRMPDLPAELAGPRALDFLAAAERGGPAGAPAPPGKLLRRLSFDLIGLPPSIAELDAFERAYAADPARACADAVERLLASPHYGEARARAWLDLARYADTNGYEKDERRTMWRWRDWVIDAFNADVPFDEFTVKQLAGDLLPNPTTDDLIATGFHRNTMINAEGGVDPEEFRVAAVVDRVNTTASVWLGTTLACAQCHSHKYDPFTQEEYYGIFAFLNQTADSGGETAPVIPAPTAEQAAQQAELETALADVAKQLDAPDAAWDAEQVAWEREMLAELAPAPDVRALRTPDDRMRTLDGAELTRTWSGFLASGPRPPREEYVIDATALDGTPLVGRVTGLRLGVDGSPQQACGRADDGNFVLTDVWLEVVRADRATEQVRFDGAWADFEQADLRFPVAHAIDGDPDGTGWAVAPRVAAAHAAWFVLREPLELADGDLARVHLRQGYGAAGWQLESFRIELTDDARVRRRYLPPKLSPWWFLGPFFDGGGEAQWSLLSEAEIEHVEGRAPAELYPDGDASRAWEPRPDWGDARVHALEGEEAAFLLRRTIASDRARDVLLKVGSDDSIKAYLNGRSVLEDKAARGAARAQDSVRVALQPGENRLLLKVVNYKGPAGFAFELEPVAVPPDVEEALRLPAIDRALAQRDRVRAYFRAEASPKGAGIRAHGEILGIQLAALRASIPTAMVMRERAEPRATHLLEKGSFLAPGAAVVPHVPAVLHAWPADAPLDRLGLARWLTAPENPLVWRVTANRLWEELFGVGLVETSADFGTRGDAPSNQALLDWLALELVRNGRSVKSLLRTIVSSETYRQDSAADADRRERDPRNVALTRGARFRLPAEAVRDAALAIASLLNEEPDAIGGPSAFPPQPEGIWAATYNSDAWAADRDERRYRRGLYTFLRRTAPYPTYLMFDATSREVACTRRARTNTPLQALAALNDPAFLEAAGGLALRTISDGGASDAERLAYGFRLCTARRPSPDELDVLARLLAAERAHYAADADAALALVGAAYPLYDVLEDRGAAVERAPWIVVANALLNLDETLTRD
jgi:hypothetical protein